MSMQKMNLLGYPTRCGKKWLQVVLFVTIKTDSVAAAADDVFENKGIRSFRCSRMRFCYFWFFRFYGLEKRELIILLGTNYTGVEGR